MMEFIGVIIEEKNKREQAEKWLKDQVQDAMIKFELDNTGMSSVLTSLANNWTGFAAVDVIRLKLENKR